MAVVVAINKLPDALTTTHHKHHNFEKLPHLDMDLGNATPILKLHKQSVNVWQRQHKYLCTKFELVSSCFHGILLRVTLFCHAKLLETLL